ncbi:restriction endonuclease subunit S [Helicobacter pylori]|uniref:restriction endonuclease subunit S n=1 Tax=Helicobacter pylori TaxID=210 RepID=UPI000FDE8EAD|nr:restriction endonuclease subunit S [Helicobacter pylori]RVY60241.1 restriction endonuclease subunit S [Helicobacter pylori]
MIGPLSSQLNAIKWGEFSYETIYELQKTTKLLSKKDCVENGKIPLFTSDSKNNGVVGYVNCKPSYKLKNNQCMVVFGDHTRTFNIAKNDFCIADNVKVLKPIKDFSIRILLFINTMWGKKIIDKGYARHWSLAKIAKIQLPLKPTANAQTLKDIDFDFMETFIAELEQCRLAELQAYLKATGLENTTLSSDEENALNLFNNNNSGGNTPCGLTWQSFKIVDIFEVKNTRNILARDVVKDSGTTPYLCASKENNAVNSYINYNADFLDKGNCIFIGGKTFVVTYQQKDFYSNDSHNLALYLKDTHSKTKLNQLFIITCIYKALNNKYSWGDSISNTKIQNDSILLPTNQHGKIDFHFMRTFINALMKQTIQGVVQYSSAKIQATKEVISQETPVQKDSLF